MKRNRPVIGVTADLEHRAEARPPRPAYILDATNCDTLRSMGAVPLMLPSELDAVDDYLDLCDGIVVSGGGYQFRVPQLFQFDGTEPPEKERRFRFEARLMQRCIERDKATLGVCGGFQVLNQVTGGDLIVALEQERVEWAGHRGAGAREMVHPVSPVAGTRFAAIVGPAAFETNSLHRQGVTRAGPGAVVAGLASDGIVEAIEVPGRRFVLGVQWHPEFLLSEPERRLFAALVDAARA
jgi:putative glutamine amidotransferase